MQLLSDDLDGRSGGQRTVGVVVSIVDLKSSTLTSELGAIVPEGVLKVDCGGVFKDVPPDQVMQPRPLPLATCSALGHMLTVRAREQQINRESVH